MTTLEQRASALMVVIECEKRLTPKKAQRLIIESFQLLIEDCAKVLDRHEKEKADLCVRADKSGFVDVGGGFALQAVALAHAATEIRALATPTDQTEGKEIESRNKCIMLGCEKGAIDPDNFGQYCQDHQIKSKKGEVER